MFSKAKLYVTYLMYLKIPSNVALKISIPIYKKELKDSLPFRAI